MDAVADALCPLAPPPRYRGTAVRYLQEEVSNAASQKDLNIFEAQEALSRQLAVQLRLQEAEAERQVGGRATRAGGRVAGGLPLRWARSGLR